MLNSLWKRILYVYFGTPLRALIFSTFLISQFVVLGYYFIQPRIERYKTLLEKAKHEQMILQDLVAEIREKQPLSISINLKELNFSEIIDKKNENQVRRLLEYGRFALKKSDYDYAKSLFQEANSLTVTNEAHYYLGIIALQTGKYKESIAFFDKIKISKNDKNYDELMLYSLIAAYKSGQVEWDAYNKANSADAKGSAAD